ncbi:hypothetical protein GQ600_22553 [Phytophthora cactorum]|nr:hypothetical protein GQ600_22553 [Phytophthora cactorum]
MPWLQALCGRLCFYELHYPCLHIDIKCCPSQWDSEFDANDEPVADGSVFVADGESRRNRERAGDGQ